MVLGIMQARRLVCADPAAAKGRGGMQVGAPARSRVGDLDGNSARAGCPRVQGRDATNAFGAPTVRGEAQRFAAPDAAKHGNAQACGTKNGKRHVSDAHGILLTYLRPAAANHFLVATAKASSWV